MYPVFLVMAFHLTVEIAMMFSSLSGDPNDFVAFNFSTGDLVSYLAENHSPVNWQKTDDGPVLSVVSPAVHA